VRGASKILTLRKCSRRYSSGPVTTDVPKEILQWSKQQPPWIQDALRRLFTAGANPLDVDELTEICKTRYGLSTKPASPLSAAHIPVAGSGALSNVSVLRITHHNGVNALAAEQKVSFGPGLTIVYGENGAGKSGYTRVLKAACRSRAVENILGNVLGGSAPLKATATIRVSDGGKEADIAWTAGGPASSALAQVSVFDGHCVPAYLKDKTDVAFRPFGLDVFDKLAAACLDVKKRLDLAIQQLSLSLLPPTLNIAAGTKVRQLLDSLSGLTKKSDVVALATMSELETKRLADLRELKRDLESTDPKKRAQELELKAGRISILAGHIATIGSTLGLPALGELRDARTTAKAKRSVLTALLQKTLTPDLLPGTGGENWRSLWNVANAFAASASVNLEDAEDSQCPLCQQNIHTDAATRLKHLAEFVNSTARQEADAAVADYSARRTAMLSLQIDSESASAAVTELATDEPAFNSRIQQCFSSAKQIQESVAALTENGDEQILAITFDPRLTADIESIATVLESRAAQLRASKASLSPEEQRELNELEARVTLGTIVDAVAADIDRKRQLAALAQCVSDTSTTPVTKKSTELTKQLITEQLRQTFQAELKRVHFTHLSVEIKDAGGSKGAMYHKLIFTNAPGVKVTDVLSEGESRALSLASFLTELSTAPTKSAIIFDDPVSSLDHQWREKIGRRLAAEAKDRQVIVFTHDLLFLKILMAEAGQQEVSCNHQHIRREGAAGICSADLPWVAMGVKERIGVLRTRLQAATALSKANQDAYESAAREIFGRLRETWERAVPEVLLNDVVERYRPSIETKKVIPLHDITEADCKAVGTGMTSCSRWILGHDEALADGTPFPKPDELKKNIDDLEEWAKNIRKRREKKSK
jgi:recombinational DNA repair ATPase RecF